MLAAFALAVAAGISYVATGAVRACSLKFGHLAVPDARSSHTRPTPQGGGLAIAGTFLTATLILYVLDALPRGPVIAVVGGGLPVAGIGLLDDRAPLPAGMRIAVHFAAAAWALYWLGGFPPLPVADGVWRLGWAGHLIGAVGIVWLLNLYNFMDGIDGLAAVEVVTVASAACLMIVAGGLDDDALWLALLAAAVLGFLPWNWAPARIFMGDVGSGFLGFTLAVLAIYTAQQGVLSLWSWLILMGVFAVDATVTLLTRIMSGQRWREPHRSHAYQHAAIRWRSHARVTLAVLAVNIVWLTPMAWFVNTYPRFGIIAAGAALLPLACLAFLLGAGHPASK
jgi:Fuc2NAc and GlcNAc transferase